MHVCMPKIPSAKTMEFAPLSAFFLGNDVKTKIAAVEKQKIKLPLLGSLATTMNFIAGGFVKKQIL